MPCNWFVVLKKSLSDTAKGINGGDLGVLSAGILLRIEFVFVAPTVYSVRSIPLFCLDKVQKNRSLCWTAIFGLYLAFWERMQHSLSDLRIKCRVRIYHVFAISCRVNFFYLLLLLSDKSPSSLKQKRTHTHSLFTTTWKSLQTKSGLAFRQHKLLWST